MLASLVILAFLVHTVLEWMDDQYQLLCRKLPSRQRLFGDIRTLTRYLCFESWGALMTFMLQSFDQLFHNPKPGEIAKMRIAGELDGAEFAAYAVL